MERYSYKFTIVSCLKQSNGNGRIKYIHKHAMKIRWMQQECILEIRSNIIHDKS